MPELPEAETIARELHRELSGRMFQKVFLLRRDVVHGDEVPLEDVLPGRRVMGVGRRGKRVILELEPHAQLIFRLGMTGSLTCPDRGLPLEAHTHLRITLRDIEQELRFRDPRRFGGIWLHLGISQNSERERPDLGPEPLDLALTEFRRILSRRRQMKALLMDQQSIAGLGNIYCDESLHAARIHPLRLANTLSSEDAVRMLRSIKATLRKAIRFAGSTLMDYRQANGQEGSFQRHHRVYQRHGQPCKSCGTDIERITAAGRSTFFCPKCQRVPLRRVPGKRGLNSV